VRRKAARVYPVCGKQSIRLPTECDNRAVAYTRNRKPEGQTTFRLVSQSFLRYERKTNGWGFYYPKITCTFPLQLPRCGQRTDRTASADP